MKPTPKQIAEAREEVDNAAREYKRLATRWRGYVSDRGELAAADARFKKAETNLRALRIAAGPVSAIEALQELGWGRRVLVRSPDNGQKFTIVPKHRLGVESYGIIPDGKKSVPKSIGYRVLSQRELAAWLQRLELA